MINEESVILKSPEPFESRYASGWFILSLFIIPFAILGLGHILFDPESFMGTACMLIGAGAFLVILILAMMNHKAAVKHMAEMRNMKFKITNNATLEKIYNKIEPALMNIYGEKVKFLRKSDCVTVTFNGINYEIVLNNDTTFSIHLQKSLLEKSIYIFARVVEIFYGRDYNDDAAPTWNYEKIRTGMPIIAYELQRAFGVTSTFENEIQPPVGQSIQEIYQRKKLAAKSPAAESKTPSGQSIEEIFKKAKLASNSTATESQSASGHSVEEIYRRKKLAAKQNNIAENSRQNLPAANNRSSRSKKFFIVSLVLIAVAGLFLMIAASGVPTPKTVDQFINQYNTEIKRTAGKILDEKYRGQGMLIEYCTLNNVKIGEDGKYQTLYDSIYFAGYDSFAVRAANPHKFDPDDQPIYINFTFYPDSAPVNAIVAIIGATISAAGDDEKKVTQALGITRENDYAVPYNYRREVFFNDKEYLINSSEGYYIIFSVLIHNK